MTLRKRFDRQMLSMTGWVGEAIVSAATIIITTARLVAPLLGSLGLDGAPYALESLARPPTPLVHQALVRSQLIGSGDVTPSPGNFVPRQYPLLQLTIVAPSAMP